MCSIFYLPVIFLISINYVYTWDIAVTAGDHLDFFTNGTKETENDPQLTELTALAYDAVHNILLFAGKYNDNASIFSYHLVKKKFRKLVIREDNIQGIAFDPLNGRLFWTDYRDKTIKWTSIKSEAKGNETIQFLFHSNMLNTYRIHNNKIPRAITMDNCRGYIYWTNINPVNATIERMRIGDNDSTVIVHEDLVTPNSIIIDQREQRIYWSDKKKGIKFTIESSNLEGGDRKQLYSGHDHRPNAIAVSKDYIYWTDSAKKSVWKIHKHINMQIEEVVSFNDSIHPYGVVAYYSIEDQMADIPQCESVLQFSRNESAIKETFNEATDQGLFCLNGDVIDKLTCTCMRGYTGRRCEHSVCENFCVNGNCNVTDDGKPICDCSEGFSGSRCEIKTCHNYCLNNGVCSMDSNMIFPMCECKDNYEGPRCASKITPKIMIHPATVSTDLCNCSKEVDATKVQKTTEGLSLASREEFYVEANGCSTSWDPVRDSVIIILGTICGLLCVICAVLITKIMHLKKRPRIKKRIIVNKNVTPLTARPDQCEITIEDCCNMNICETPCFEPNSMRTPKIKKGKEEKRNLISHMEHPDDLY